MRFVSKNVIEIDRELSDLDLFALDFIRILKRHTDYVVVSGYVSILLGRARASEDIDIIIPKMGFPSLVSLVRDLERGGFYCLNAEKEDDIRRHIDGGLALRFAKEGMVVPNAEVKIAKNRIDDLTLERKIRLKMGMEEFAIPPLEMQVAFKEAVLKSPKDMEDSRHIRNVARGHLDHALISKYKVMLDGFYG